jgi:hypothetical protein
MELQAPLTQAVAVEELMKLLPGQVALVVQVS